MFHYESRTAAHPQQRLLLALVLHGLCSGSVPFGAGLYDLWCWSYFGSSLPRVGFVPKPTCRGGSIKDPIFVVDCFVFFQLFWQ